MRFRRRSSVDDVSRSSVGPSYSIQDPALAEFLGLSGRNDAGVDVTESSALGLTAVFRSVSLVAQTLAALPLKTYRRDEFGNKIQVPSVFDDPGGDVYTPFEFKELVVTHLLLHGNAYLLHLYNGAGTLDSLFPIHPSLVTVEWDAEQHRKRYTVQTATGAVLYWDDALTHVMGLSTDGLKGMSPISVARNALGTGIAADKAAARMFSSGMLLGGLVSSDEHLSAEQAEELKVGLKAKLSGTQNAGDIAVVNASLKFTPWTGTSEDMQFIESRGYQIDEVARIFGVPRELLSANGATSWGSGIQELVRGFARFTLNSWTSRLEERFSRLLSNPRYVEFEMAGLLQGTPAEEIELLARQIDIGLLTIDEARAIRNLAPLTTDQRPAAPTEEGDAA